jgi:hypothetical protein
MEHGAWSGALEAAARQCFCCLQTSLISTPPGPRDGEQRGAKRGPLWHQLMLFGMPRPGVMDAAVTRVWYELCRSWVNDSTSRPACVEMPCNVERPLRFWGSVCEALHLMSASAMTDIWLGF